MFCQITTLFFGSVCNKRDGICCHAPLARGSAPAPVTCPDFVLMQLQIGKHQSCTANASVLKILFPQYKTIKLFLRRKKISSFLASDHDKIRWDGCLLSLIAASTFLDTSHISGYISHRPPKLVKQQTNDYAMY